MKFHPSHSNRGVALVTTIIVVAVMATITVALLQTTGTDRVSSRAVANNFQARLLAEAGVAQGVEALTTTGLDFLVNSYVEKTVTFDGGTTTSPYLATHRLGPDFSSVAETRLLVSFAGNYSDITEVPAEELVDINDPAACSTPNLVGLTTANGTAVPVPAGWVNVLKNSTQEENNDSASQSYNPVIGRFAFWIDDESAKLDINTAGNLTTANELKRLAGANTDEVSPLLFLSQNGSDANAASDFIPDRNEISEGGLFLSPDTSRLLDGAGYLSSNWTTLRSMLTNYSKGDERGPFRTRKINLNDFVELDTDISSPGSRDQIATATVALGDYINRVIPEFGGRAYNGEVTVLDRRRYCIQIAANIRDYIDADSQPTAITQNNLWLQPPNPTEIGAGAPTNPPLAFGKEILPSITEYVGYYYDSSNNLRIDHSFELLNIYTSSVNMTSLGQVSLIMSERNEISPGTTSDAPDPDVPGEPGTAPLRIILPNSPYPSGQYAILTTLPAGSQFLTEWIQPGAIIINVSSNENTAGYPFGSNGLRMEGDQLASSADVNTEICLVNNRGYLDIHARVAQQGALTFRPTNIRKVASQPFGNVATTAGNNVHRGYPLDSGDPRSNIEVYPAYSEPGIAPSAIAWRRNTSNTNASGTLLGGDTNSGSAGFIPNNSTPNQTFHLPEPLLQTGNQQLTREIATIRNGPMKTIGELGLIYDPAVHGSGYNNNGGADTRERGGFRTLSIGSDVGEARGPNRLAHTMPTTGNSTISQRRAYRLLDIFSANNSETGKILVNSSLRNPQNLPLRALFHNLEFQSNTTSNATSDFAAPSDGILGAEGQNLNLDALLEDWTNFERSRPFLSIGQIADLETLTNSDLGVNLSPNPANTNALDRGREELLRNTFGLLTLKGSVYKIYTVGQAGTVDASGEFQPKATAFLERTVELERVYPEENGLQATLVNNLVTNNTATRINVKTISTKYH